MLENHCLFYLRHMQKVSENIRQLQEMGKTIFIISHDPEFIFRSCNYVLHIEKGKVADFYPLDDNWEKKLAAFFLKDSIKESQLPFKTDCPVKSI